VSTMRVTTLKNESSTIDQIVLNADGSFGGELASELGSKYDTGNILGTVSQSGGTPTGAIIETGSNANGVFTRFADGTQICHLTVSLVGFNASGGNAYTWTFPAAFSSAPRPQVSTRRAAVDFVISGSFSALSSSSTTVTHNAGVSAGGDFLLFAIGRWF